MMVLCQVIVDYVFIVGICIKEFNEKMDIFVMMYDVWFSWEKVIFKVEEVDEFYFCVI